jgi:hypothetical protein
MECWELKADDILILNSIRCHLYKIDRIPPIQYSNTPAFHHSMRLSNAGGHY